MQVVLLEDVKALGKKARLSKSMTGMREISSCPKVRCGSHTEKPQ